MTKQVVEAGAQAARRDKKFALFGGLAGVAIMVVMGVATGIGLVGVVAYAVGGLVAGARGGLKFADELAVSKPVQYSDQDIKRISENVVAALDGAGFSFDAQSPSANSFNESAPRAVTETTPARTQPVTQTGQRRDM